jgi:hypothetical protein
MDQFNLLNRTVHLGETVTSSKQQIRRHYLKMKERGLLLKQEVMQNMQNMQNKQNNCLHPEMF